MVQAAVVPAVARGGAHPVASVDAAPATVDISVVLPCLNEAAGVGITISKALDWLARNQRDGEVLVVDNGSTDGSIEIAEAAGARVVREPRRGYGSAYQRGFREARGRVIVMGDADDTYDFANLGKLVDPVERGEADMVLGNRFSGGIAEGGMPFLHRHVGSPAINFMLRAMFGVRVGDSQSGFRAFKRDRVLALGLRGTGMEFASEMIVAAARNGWRLLDVPSPYAARLGDSKLSTVRDGWRHLRFMLLKAPDFLFVGPGLVALLAGLGVFGMQFLHPFGTEIGSFSWQPVFAGPLLVAVGSSTLLFGAIAKVHGAARGLLPETRMVRFWRRTMGLERMLGFGIGLTAIGLAVDIGLFFVWTAGIHLDRAEMLAGLAQTLLIVGIQFAFSAFLLVVVDDKA
jgi:glycosyltransferase involved in cell wall biosynthesis